jgi:hypothetical protein
MVNRPVEKEIERDARAMDAIVKCRIDVRNTLQFTPEGSDRRKLTNAEARHYAYKAMAALDFEEDETRYGRDNNGERYTVGPYTDQAVFYVLRDVSCTEYDTRLVHDYAALFNVVARITV